MITFGGAYAVLPYVSQLAVEHYNWLTTGQMMDGLGLAETTPGPLIMVVQFVGFLGGWNHPGFLPPLLSATTIGALLTTWVTFVPCFCGFFWERPILSSLRKQEPYCYSICDHSCRRWSRSELAVWFAIHALFPVGIESTGLF
jgi:chromate transporter